jgi:hypothetical protein
MRFCVGECVILPNDGAPSQFSMLQASLRLFNDALFYFDACSSNFRIFGRRKKHAKEVPCLNGSGTGGLRVQRVVTCGCIQEGVADSRQSSGVGNSKQFLAVKIYGLIMWYVGPETSVDCLGLQGVAVMTRKAHFEFTDGLS